MELQWQEKYQDELCTMCTYQHVQTIHVGYCTYNSHSQIFVCPPKVQCMLHLLT